MAYTVLARKYRSWTFDELVGQEAVATTLKNAIESGRLHHGYLFCGTRGVGKTSAARILARSLNCLNSDGPTVKPCCECDSCTTIAEGQDVDVIEIDAASNTGVDNIRELRSNTVYRPARSRFKIYIIDEVHMLSTGAFNALLKTLEEPPGHVKFIMATTESQKVPATIQSRCLRFDFRSIPADKIAAHFHWILEQEKIQVDPAVVRRVARLGNGSMRDGLSLLDQLLSMGADKLTMEVLNDVLPVAHDETLTRVVEQIADRDPGGALGSLDSCLAAGYSLERFAETLAEELRTLMLLKVCGPQTELVELPPALAERMTALAGRFDPESYVYMISVLEELRRNIRFSALGRALTEATLVRMAGSASYSSVQTLISHLEGSAAMAGGSSPGAAGSGAARTAFSPSAPAAAQPSTPHRPAAASPAASQIASVTPTATSTVTPTAAPTETPTATRTPTTTTRATPTQASSAPASGAVEGAPPASRSTGAERKTESESKSPASGSAGNSGDNSGGDSGVDSGARSGARSRSGSTGKAAGGATARATSAGNSGPTPEDLREATNEPLVREAMDLFQGTLVNVERDRKQAKGKDAKG